MLKSLWNAVACALALGASSLALAADPIVIKFSQRNYDLEVIISAAVVQCYKLVISKCANPSHY